MEKQRTLDWYGAAELFHEALQLNPSYGEAWFRQAQCSYQLEEFSLCLTYLDNADMYLKARPDIKNLRGMALISLGRLDDARAIFDSILVSYPNDIDARFGLAELDLFDGRVTGAELKYKEALKRQGTNRKALLSLALVSAELGKDSIAKNYIDQALQTHSGDAEVHYLAAWLYARQGNLTEAEKRARSAIEIDGNYDSAYELLASILFSEKQYKTAIDICDYRIGRNRNNITAWYLKGLAQHKLGNNAEAVSTWNAGLSVAPQDEIMRSAMELLIGNSISMEDGRRPRWAQYHIGKAVTYSDKYQNRQARYEYQRALRLDPLNREARNAFATMLRHDGYNEAYLEQLKFIRDSSKEGKTTGDNDVQLTDTIEAFNSLLSDNLASTWNVKPFYLDKIRWKLGIYYTAPAIQMLHPDVSSVTAAMAADLFTGVATTSVDVKSAPVAGYGAAYTQSRKAQCDYFILLNVEDSDREFSLDAVMYSTRTGNEVKRFSVFRTGNDRYALALQKFRQDVLDVLPIRGKILARKGNDLLVDLGLSDNIKKDTEFSVVRQGVITTADNGPGLYYNKQSVLGTVKLTKVDEEVSQGTLQNTGFFDRVNIGDEVVVTKVPAADTTQQVDQQTTQPQADQTVASDTAPAADSQGQNTVPLITPEELGIQRQSALVDMIQKIY